MLHLIGEGDTRDPSGFVCRLDASDDGERDCVVTLGCAHHKLPSITLRFVLGLKPDWGSDETYGRNCSRLCCPKLLKFRLRDPRRSDCQPPKDFFQCGIVRAFNIETGRWCLHFRTPGDHFHLSMELPEMQGSEKEVDQS